VGIDLADPNDLNFLEAEAAIAKWEDETLRRYEVWKQERIKLIVHVFICTTS